MFLPLFAEIFQLVFFCFKMALLHTEWVLKAERIKPMNVLRYSDGVVLISQLSKSCSCGIKTDTVPVSDLDGGRGEEKKKKRGK